MTSSRATLSVISCMVVACFQFSTGKAAPPADEASYDCRSAAKSALGPDAEVGRCGHLVGGASLEAVAFIKLRRFADGRDGLPVSRLVILRRDNSHWSVALNIAKQIQNSSGYIGIDYIDDSLQYPGYRVAFLDRRADGKPAFVLKLSYLR